MNKISILLSVLLVAAIALLASAWRQSELLQSQQSVLMEKVAALEMELADARAAGKRAATEVDQSSAQKSELMRLRNEVTQLRGASQQAANLQADNARLREQLQQARASANDALSKPDAGTEPRAYFREEWTYSGYATPEAALLSTLWAMREGRSDVFRTSLTGKEAEERLASGSQQELAAKIQDEANRFSSVQILQEVTSSPTETILHADLGAGVQKYKFQQVGQEWKYAGKVNGQQQQAASTPTDDPLSFYQRNPELMKRYFPHLAQEQQAEAAQPGQVQPGVQPQGAQGQPQDPLSYYRQNPELMKRYFPHLAQEQGN